MKINDIMNKNVIVVDYNTDLNELATIMKQNDIGFVPISKNNKIIGVITDRDIVIRALSNNDNKLEGYLSIDLITIDSESTIEEALKLMGQKKVKRLLVNHDNKLVGIISLSDIIKYDNELFLETLKRIWEINRNNDTYKTDINEFEL